MFEALDREFREMMIDVNKKNMMYCDNKLPLLKDVRPL
jgi:hypothetical protein